MVRIRNNSIHRICGPDRHQFNWAAPSFPLLGADALYSLVLLLSIARKQGETARQHAPPVCILSEVRGVADSPHTIIGEGVVVKLNFGTKPTLMLISIVGLALCFALPGVSQSSAGRDSETTGASAQQKKKSDGPVKEMSGGAKDIGKGTAKGSVDLGKGVAGGATDLVTGHPIDAGASVGKGAAGFGTHAGVGAGKGTYKIGKGLGGALKKLGRKL